METAVARFWFDRPRGALPKPAFSAGVRGDNFFWLHELQDSYLRWHKATGGSALEVHIYGPPKCSPFKTPFCWLTPTATLLPPSRAGRASAAPGAAAQPPSTRYSRRRPGSPLGFAPLAWLFCCGDWVRHPSRLLPGAGLCDRHRGRQRCAGRPGAVALDLMDYLPPEPLAGWIERVMRRGVSC